MDAPKAAERGPWWRDRQFWLLLVSVGLLYFTRLHAGICQGEESRRGLIAVEMLRTGDWIVPHQQGTLFVSRPPLQNWAIAACGWLRGEVDEVAIRLPSALGVLFMALVVYGYSRRFLSPTGAFTAGVISATYGQTLELGRLGETEALFTLLVSGSLMIWHAGNYEQRRSTAAWFAACGLVALGTLTKGLQAPVYFAASVGVYLLLTRRWREALRPAPLAAAGAGLLVVSAWLVPFAARQGLDGLRAIFSDDVVLRFEELSPALVVQHLVAYPLEVGVCLLPWSVLAMVYTAPEFRARLGGARDGVLFLTLALLVTFPTCWFVPGARERYFMPLYPCAAPLLALVIARAAELAPGPLAACTWRRHVVRFLTGLAAVMAVIGLFVLAASAWGRGQRAAWPLVPPLGAALLFAGASLVLAGMVLAARRCQSAGEAERGVLAVAAFLGFFFNGFVLSSEQRAAPHTRQQVAHVRDRLPPGARLVSLGLTDHLFAFYFERPIPCLPPPSQAAERKAAWDDVTYFCYAPGVVGGSLADIPFAWEPLGVVSSDRVRQQPPQRPVYIGRRIRPEAGGRQGAVAPPPSSRAAAPRDQAARR